MKKINLLICAAVIVLSTTVVFAQKQKKIKPVVKSKPVAISKPIVFAVLSDGTTLEPIGVIDKGKLTSTTAGDDEGKLLSSFVNSYYKPKSTYNLIFGAASNGNVTVKSASAKSDCAKNQAEIITQSNKAKLKGFVMGLATNVKTGNTSSGLRRLPTATERAEIEMLVRAELGKQGVAANTVKNLKYYNLTALDVDSDGKPEMVGSFWTETSDKERNLVFFIADKNSSGKYEFGYSEYKKVTPDQVMSGKLKDLDELGGELLLDALEYDGDTTAEVFTIARAFEGNNFYVYSRRAGKWSRVFEGYNYHCAY